MNTTEAAKLLALIKLAYPTAYKGYTEADAQATAIMWQQAFPHLQYRVAEIALRRHIKSSKFAPTVADIVEQLKAVHNFATDRAAVCYALRQADKGSQYDALAAATEEYMSVCGGDTPPAAAGAKVLEAWNEN